MISLLYLNSYANTLKEIESLSLNGPRHHLWGIDVLSKQFTIVYPELVYRNIYGNKYLRIIYRLFFQIFIFIRYHKVDIVYAACSGLTEIFSLFKMLGFYKGKVIYIHHHFTSVFLFKGLDKIITISDDISKYLKEKYTDYKEKIINIPWGGDSDFYKKFINQTSKKYTFIQNGKTSRDNDLLINAIENIGESAVLFTVPSIGEGGGGGVKKH
jgi:glycosyltransferase involved in cell wall biosynthesis